jgi:hypothetical protein
MVRSRRMLVLVRYEIRREAQALTVRNGTGRPSFQGHAKCVAAWWACHACMSQFQDICWDMHSQVSLLHLRSLIWSTTIHSCESLGPLLKIRLFILTEAHRSSSFHKLRWAENRRGRHDDGVRSSYANTRLHKLKQKAGRLPCW